MTKLEDIKKDLNIERVESKKVLDILLNKHYLYRRPSISFAYSLFYKGEVVGVITIGKPASPAVGRGLMGRELTKHVYELNRMFVDDKMPPNTGSYFLGKVLKMLKPHNIILISYSDIGMGHNGYIYQATNFYYVGQTQKSKDPYSPSGQHPRHTKEEDEYKHLRRVRSPKNRYVYFCTNKKTKKTFLKNLKYPILEYPKGENKNYLVGEEKQKTLIWNKLTDEYYWEEENNLK